MISKEELAQKLTQLEKGREEIIANLQAHNGAITVIRSIIDEITEREEKERKEVELQVMEDKMYFELMAEPYEPVLDLDTDSDLVPMEEAVE